MKRFLSNYWRIGLTALFGLVVFLFWRYRYPFALTYQEQFQLFLFDSDYFCERMAEPGGFARYIAEFLTQFYNSMTIGAVILAVALMLVQRLSWRVLAFSPQSQSLSPQFYPLSFIPALMLWYALGDESLLLAYTVALVLSLAVLVGLRGLGHLGTIGRGVLVMVVIPLLYWLLGPMVLLVAAMLLPWVVAAAAILLTLACIFASAWVLPYPLLRLLQGVGYYRFPEVLPYVLLAIPVVIWALRWLLSVRAVREAKDSRFLLAGMFALVAAMGLLIVPKGFDAKKYELIEYDYLVRVKDWNGIIAKAERQTPDLPMSVSALNLALAMTNQLGERAFDFYQRGSEGLLPRFERNFSTTQLTGEIYFHLGLVNTAQRFAFEAMEAIPNYNKSARVVKRLAETNLINGQYDVARKYLRMLEKTIFYRPFARRTLAILGDDEAINAHPLYGTLRRYRLQEDFLFSDRELDKICGQLFMHDHQNRMAAQYLLMVPLLDKDIPRFMQYVQYVQGQIQYNPRCCQEAIAFAFMQQRRQPPQGVVSPMVLRQMNEFMHIYSSGGRDASSLAQFRNTVWYYLTAGI